MVKFRKIPFKFIYIFITNKDIFMFDDDFLKMVFVSNYKKIDGGSIKLTPRQIEIVEMIKDNHKIAYRTLAE